MAEALYRKYRPQIFEDVVGQEHIERTIKNAIAQDKVSHAYLFTGPRGTGKTTTARLLAKALLCERGPTPEPDGTGAGTLALAEEFRARGAEVWVASTGDGRTPPDEGWLPLAEAPHPALAPLLPNATTP